MKTDLNKIDKYLLIEGMLSTIALIVTCVFFATLFKNIRYLQLQEIDIIVAGSLPTAFSGLTWLAANITGSIRIMATKWNNSSCNKMKAIFGLLSLISFLGIIILIFIAIAKSKIAKERKNNYITVNSENEIITNLDFNKLRDYRTRAIYLLILTVFLIPLIIFLHFWVIKNYYYNFRVNTWINDSIIPVFIATIVVSNSLFALSIIFSSWDIIWCKKNAILFGILSLVFSWITLFMFTSTGLKKAKEQLKNPIDLSKYRFNNNKNNDINNSNPFINNNHNFANDYSTMNNAQLSNTNPQNIVKIKNIDDYGVRSKSSEVADTLFMSASIITDILSIFG